MELNNGRLGSSFNGNNEANYTELDSDSDDEIQFIGIQRMHNHVQHAKNILRNYMIVVNKNAIITNREMQAKLLNLHEMLTGLLHKCEQKYLRNKDTLEGSRKSATYPYGKCGAPFFKDLDKFPAPVNSDYRTRVEEKGELFPLDLKMIPQHHWTVTDRRNLVQAVKTQVLNYLHTRKRIEKHEFNRVTRKNMKQHSSRLANLFEIAGDNFKIDWELVSKMSLKERHSEANCYAMWQGYLRPDLNRGEWRKHENENLMRVAKKYNFQNWSLISQEIPGRSENQCFVQFQHTVNLNLNSSKKWTAYEDRQLLRAVKLNSTGGNVNWNKVRGYFINRDKKSICRRYTNVLNPNIKKGRFSREEDCVLLAALEKYGENFACIPMSLFPNRSRSQVKTRWHNTIKYQNVHQAWTVEDDEKLIEYVKQNGKGKWAELAKIMKTHTRTSCRTRYSVIEKFFAKNPVATVKDIPRKNRGLLTDVNRDNWVEKIYELKTQGDTYAEKRAKRREVQQRRRENRPCNYRNLLRPVGRQFYELFKYSYDYDFQKSPGIQNFVKKTIPILFNCYEFEMPIREFGNFHKSFTRNEARVLVASYSERNRKEFHGTQEIPPNWAALLGLRALVILKNSDNYTKITQKVTTKSRTQTSAEYTFSKRFFNTFFNTTLLTKLNPSLLGNDNDFVLRYFSDESKSDVSDPCKSATPDSCVEELTSPSAKKAKL
ncbi:unnamed protein product [Hermetia illucens]|uniref:snRNA-activating protein complex subunit 4 n=1 Tax=Hermetia illucens TaxID=343691 RepID=A0A7R8V5B6_HERIL|nr:uncharacterized protein LOC119660434 [Hermetia illucens]CAD7093125.1 unnamed protein product [Hermetia illucens]